MEVAKPVRTEVVFTNRDGKPAAGTQQVRIEGISSELLAKPEQLRKIMELLELPEGTVARILHTTEDVVVR